MLLALDLAKRMGWAAADRGRVPLFGEVDLLPKSIPFGGNEGLAYTRLRAFMLDKIAVLKPREIWIEEPVPAFFQKRAGGGFAGNWHTFRVLNGLAAVADQVATEHSIPVHEQQPKTIRYQVLDDAGAGKNGVLWWCHDNGWKVPGDNAADALALLQYGADCDGDDGWKLTPGPDAQKAQDDVFARDKAAARGEGRPPL